MARVEADTLRRMATAIRAGREYWTPRLLELKAMRAAEKLIPELKKKERMRQWLVI